VIEAGKALLGIVTSVAVLALMFGPLERAWPARPQPALRPEWGIDLTFLLGQYLLWNAVALWLLERCAALADGWRPAAVWAQPTWLVALEAVLLGDLAVYWFHRACHAVPLLWRFHAVHHSAEHLDWVAAHREHPLDGIATQLVVNAPAFLLGFSPAALSAFIIFRGLWAIFIHSNVRLPLGPLKWLFGAPELHHWHHAALPHTRHNFGNLAPWTDLLFGTHYCPPDPERYPLGLVTPWPRGYLQQLLAPFRR